MVEPTRRTSRLAIAGGALAAVAVAGGGFLAGRRTAQVPAPAAPPPAAPTPAPAPPPVPLPVVQPPLDRAALLHAAGEAADAFAAGRPAPESVAALAGREFELRIPFGCPGAASPETAPLSWRYDDEEQALRLRAAPVQWAAEQWLPTGGKSPVEAIEGFWIERPWTSSEACPPAAAPPAPAAPEAETLGVAQFYAAGSSRIGRRDGKAFEAVEKVAPEALDASRGFRLRLHGRIAAIAGGPVLCRAPAGWATRPTCLIAVDLDEVAFESPADGRTIARWDMASEPAGAPAKRES